MVSRPRPRGGMSGPHLGGGCPGLGGVSQHALRQTPQQTATAADPTGMHSCSLDFCLPAGNVFFNLEFVLFVFKKKLGMWNSGRPLATDIGPINGHRKWTAPSN